jgi:hypothetical protein
MCVSGAGPVHFRVHVQPGDGGCGGIRLVNFAVWIMDMLESVITVDWVMTR